MTSTENQGLLERRNEGRRLLFRARIISGVLLFTGLVANIAEHGTWAFLLVFAPVLVGLMLFSSQRRALSHFKKIREDPMLRARMQAATELLASCIISGLYWPIFMIRSDNDLQSNGWKWFLIFGVSWCVAGATAAGVVASNRR